MADSTTLLSQLSYLNPLNSNVTRLLHCGSRQIVVKAKTIKLNNNKCTHLCFKNSPTSAKTQRQKKKHSKQKEGLNT